MDGLKSGRCTLQLPVQQCNTGAEADVASDSREWTLNLAFSFIREKSLRSTALFFNASADQTTEQRTNEQPKKLKKPSALDTVQSPLHSVRYSAPHRLLFAQPQLQMQTEKINIEQREEECTRKA